ncbi:hypothetical protein BY458DRAFT_510885 [Sporodiniella umbellata]|nr:hypothetical protein BY458DRAFT_510885 [Sporodiniella umbellata]
MMGFIRNRMVSSGFLVMSRRSLANQAGSSTAALGFKKNHRGRRYGPVPVSSPASVSDAVSNILYNTPDSNTEPETRHTLNCLVQNEPGVLSRVSGIMAGRGFNIESLVVAKTEVVDLSRMTIVFNGHSGQIEQARRQLEDMVPVWAVLDYTKTKLVERELLLIKVSILGPEYLHEQLPTKKLDDSVDTKLTEKPPCPSDTLRATFSHLRALTELTRLFDGKVVDVSSDCVILQVCAKSDRLTSFVKLCKPFGILESSRTGVMAMPRSPVHDTYSPQTEHAYEKEEAVDATLLPPG